MSGEARRTKEAELNEAVLRYIIRCVEESPEDLKKRLGVNDDLVDELVSEIPQIRLKELQRLTCSTALLARPKLNEAAFRTLLRLIRSDRDTEGHMLNLLKARAPYEMLSSLFGIDRKEFSRLRHRNGLSGNGGRPPVASEEQEQKLITALGETPPEELKQTRDSSVWLGLCEETGMRLDTLWGVIQQWSITQ